MECLRCIPPHQLLRLHLELLCQGAAVDRKGFAGDDVGELVHHHDYGPGYCADASECQVRVCEFCEWDWLVAEWNRYVLLFVMIRWLIRDLIYAALLLSFFLSLSRIPSPLVFLWVKVFRLCKQQEACHQTLTDITYKPPPHSSSHPQLTPPSIHSRPHQHQLRLRLPRLRHPPRRRSPPPRTPSPHRNHGHRRHRLRHLLDLLHRPLLQHEQPRRPQQYPDPSPHPRPLRPGAALQSRRYRSRVHVHRDGGVVSGRFSHVAIETVLEFRTGRWGAGLEMAVSGRSQA